MNKAIPIIYRDYYDIPRMIYFTYEGQAYLFDCPFDDAIDQYKDYYLVFLMPSLTDEQLSGTWERLTMKAISKLTRINTNEVHFDASCRISIQNSIIDKLRKDN